MNGLRFRRAARRGVAALAAGALLAITGVSVAQRESRPVGYLSPGEFDVTTVLQPAPRKGDPRYDADRRTFRATRALLDTPRGRLAAADVDTSPAAMMADFSCAVGVTLTSQDAPALLRVVARAGIDTGAQTNRAKNFYRRQRPFHQDRGRVCQPVEQLADSFDYPSGHTTWGWTWALILAELVPDRAQQVLVRGRAYGDSRYVCGAHNESAVEAGMASASATLAVVRSKAAYQSDLAAARAEIAGLRNDPAAARPRVCAAEQALVLGDVNKAERRCSLASASADRGRARRYCRLGSPGYLPCAISLLSRDW